MGIRGKFVVAIVVIAFAVGLSSYLALEASHSGLIEQEALRIAEIVSTQVIADRAEYTKGVVGKLKADGTGAARQSDENPGYVQLPAQFVRNVSKRVEAQAGDLYFYVLVSQWNLNEDQGIKDDFDRWAWNQLAAQDEGFRKNGAPAGPRGHDWKPAYSIESVNGAPLLRYMRADPAAAAACVSCHNGYEKRPEVMAMRETQGVAPGKQWQLHELMGAIRVEVPVDEVAAAAAAGRNRMLAGIAAIFVLGFGGLFAMISKTVINPVESSVNQVEGFSDKVSSVVGCSKDLVLAADDQQKACRQTISSVGNGDANQGSEDSQLSTSLQGLANAANDNAMKAEESAVYCNDLDESFEDLKSRLQQILGR